MRAILVPPAEIERQATDASIGLVQEHEVYAVVGEQGFRHLINAFYKQIPDDEILSPLYKGRDLAGAELRLSDFLIYRFGGPQHYIERRGHPRLRMRHFPFAVGPAARDRWMELMNRALDQTDIPEEAKQVLRDFFDSTATFLINRPA